MNIFRKAIKNLHPAAPLRAATLAAAGLLSIAASAQEYQRLITDIKQISGIGTNPDKLIIDPSDVDAIQPTFSMDNKFEVTLNNPITLTSTQGLIMYMARYQLDGAPTLVQIEGAGENEAYQTLGYAHFQYRGGDNTHEFSDPIYTITPTTVSKLRISVLKVTRPSDDDTKGYRLFKLNFFTYQKGDPYPDDRLDPLRYGTDYYRSFYGYAYQPNNGILDPHNHYGGNLNYPEETPWGENNTFVYDGEVHELPTFDKQGGGQMPHVTEQTLYAMPGDIISLSPYYDLPTSGNYYEKFSHWYGYYPRNSRDELQEQDYHHITDSNGNRMLDFLIDPAAIVLTDNAGYFAGSAFPRPIGTYVIKNFDDLKKFSDLVYQGNGYQHLDAILAADIDCEGARLEPIGRYNGTLNATMSYCGNFNGNGHTISNLSIIQHPWDYNIGFFGQLGDGATITGLNLVDVKVVAGGRAGVLAGTATGLTTIEKCLVKGDVDITSPGGNEGDENIISYAGGILGIAIQGAQVNMSEVGFIGNVTGGYGDDGSNGALVGYFETGTIGNITNCYADATVGNIYGQNGMFNNFNPVVTVSNSFMNVLSSRNIPDTDILYKVHQPGFSNIYPTDSEAFHSLPEAYEKAAGSHYVRVYGIPDDPVQWPAVYINCWGGGLDTGWPGIQLTKGDGYYYTTIPNRGIASMMVNNGNDSNEHDYVMGKNPEFSGNVDPTKDDNGNITNEGTVSIVDFGANEKDYRITYNGNLKKLTVQELTESAPVNKIYVAKNEKWDGYALLMTNRDGQTYTKTTPDAEELHNNVDCVVFNIPADFNRFGLKYSVLPYKGNQTNNILFKSVANPMPAQPAGTHRIFLKKFSAQGWENIRAYVWSEESLGNYFPGNEANGTVIIDGDEYLYYDLPSVLGAWGGITFTNGIQGEVNGERQFKDAIVYYDGDMMVEVTEVSSTFRNQEGKLKGGYFNPVYFEYQENQPVPELTVDGQTYSAGTVTVNGKKYYYINFAPVHPEEGRLIVGENQIGDRQNPIVINRNEVVSIDRVWASQNLENITQFFSALPLDMAPTVYLDTRDFYDVVRDGLGWEERYDVPAPAQSSTENVGESVIDVAKFMSHDALRWYGTEATFYQPYKTAFAPDSKENLSLEKSEYHIAADFANEFNSTSNAYNLDREGKVIHEPVINFRHIFHIKDGKTFADANTTSKQKNELYLKNNSRSVSARADHDFQIRLTQQVPHFPNNDTHNYTSTNFYYKKGENDYARVPRVGIEILDQAGNMIPDQTMFFFDANTETQGTRKYKAGDNGFAVRGDNNGTFYHTGNGGGSVYRSLYCAAGKAKAGTYTIRLKALNYDGTEIKIFGSEDDNLYIDQYVITFLPDDSASLLTEEELKNDANFQHTTEYLEQEDVCGPPAVVVDYDQYRAFEQAPYNPADYFRHHGNGASDRRSYKWPVLWQKSTYSFGYGNYYTYDYNEYIIANHSDEVMYHAAADGHTNADSSQGLFDRLYYDTYAANPAEAQKGYFFYVNAASDPGVAARLTINKLCPGSTVAVSAWIAEMSNVPEVANLCFNFVAVDGDGNREIVHSFVTGYVDGKEYGSHANRHNANTSYDEAYSKVHEPGQWIHVYYSFIPDLSNIQNLTTIDHYELELENNCVSSNGADYAVDDIRAYIISPEITARQLNPVCDANQNTVGIRLRSRFDKLLSSNGLEETNAADASEITLHFAVLDKKKYDSAYAEYQNKDFETDAERTAELNRIVRNSAIRVVDTYHDDQDNAYFTPLIISTYYDGLPEYNEQTLNEAMRYTAGRAKYFQANIQPTDTDLRPGKDYYIVLYAQYADLPSPEEEGLSIFAITDDPCAKYAVMTLQGSGVIKIDGIAYNDGEPIDVCEGQSPVVQVDLKMLHDDKEINMPAYNDYDNAPAHYYDWFVGPVDEFMATPENGGSSYYDLLYLFRNGETPGGESTPSGKGNIDADQLPDPVEGEDKYAPLRQLIKEGRLVLHASSFVFPPLKNTDEADNIHVLTAMPIIPGPDDEEGYKVCSQPNEIRLRVQNNSPLMFDGFTGIDYPEADVPVRVGLSQLRSVRELGALTIEDRTGNRLGLIPNVTIPENLRKLEIPLRGLLSYKGEDVAAEMTMAGNRNEAADPYVYLVETDDPAYISLDKHPMQEMPIRNSLLPIGMVDNLSAKTTEYGKNNVTILFDENMQFAEGYYYRVRFAFDEVIPTEVEGYCEGHVVFTIKVVPEYQKWTGADSRNWNNDANWSRVTADDILLPAGDAKTDDFTVVQNRRRIPLIVDADGNVTPKPAKQLPSNRRSYAPLDFTKVLISKMANDTTTGYPYMFAATEKNIMTLHDEMSWNNRALPAGIPTMEPTENIEYDMVSLDLKDGPLAMRPWYANTCEQIHFNHGAEMAHQESFIFEKNYQKAWVDMEMTGDRWYTLASPLQGVVAGDMYTKTDGGKQDNELYTDITFNNTDYGRYEPAVYQRGWNKAEAATYLLGDNSHDSKSAAVQLNWSRVYNDVEEAYAPGLGFSIRTATDGITAPDKDDNGNVTVRFRLPKADDSYSYFDKNDNTEGADDTTVGRTGNRHALTAFGDDGKLTVNLTVGTDGTYFLAGNPFMARMKMAEFLAANADVIEQAYWIMTDDRQEAALWDEKSGTFISTDKTEATDGTIAPMQGFFVKAKEKGSTLPLTFTPAMIDEGEIDNSVILRAPRADRRQLLSISAIDAEGETASRALIKLDAEASATFESSEDVTLLIDRTLEEHPSVYTVASGQALAINSLDAIVETEVGLLANEESAHTLLFEGVDESEGLRLLDTVTGEISDLYDGMEIEVKGAAAGRYYIVRPSDMMEEVTMAILLKERTVSVVAETAGITARVYTPDGLCSGEWSTADSLLHFDLEPGIFIVEAMADGHRMMRKFIVR